MQNASLHALLQGQPTELDRLSVPPLHQLDIHREDSLLQLHLCQLACLLEDVDVAPLGALQLLP